VTSISWPPASALRIGVVSTSTAPAIRTWPCWPFVRISIARRMGPSNFSIVAAIGPHYKHSEAFSFQIATDDQEETDRYWNAIVGNGGQESQCGWCKDKWDVSWQITPRVLTDALAKGGDAAQRAFEAMMPMKKIDVAAIEAAVRG
jgi:3-demethylubiquinone-9 3-methyltransferase